MISRLPPNSQRSSGDASHRALTDKIRTNRQKRIADQICTTDGYRFFNLLTGPGLLAFVDTQLPEHRERTYPPTVTLSLFVTQALMSDGSCQNAVKAMW